MKIHNVAQGSTEWLQLRAGVPTASELDAILTPEFKVRTGEMPRTYQARKLAEWWLGGPLPSFKSFQMEQGNVLEDEAKPWYSLETGEEITNVGFCTTDDGQVGCSPDGLLGDAGGIEIKCPLAETHVRYLLAGELPKDYTVQVHASMFVTGRKWWKFVSYRRGFPALVLTVELDDEIVAKIEDALGTFLEAFTEGKSRMTTINGGPPHRAPLGRCTRCGKPLGAGMKGYCSAECMNDPDLIP